jgi:hypothetical protein
VSLTELFWVGIVDMSNNKKCAVQDTGKIYYNLDSIDVKVDPTKTRATAFEAAFLGDVIDEITGSCFTIQENCKSQYPQITNQNYKNWITSIDQDNRIALAHVLEMSKVPILYNTPRLCDPGMTMSKNWSLKNYIETRLYAFKFKYNMGRDILPRNQNNCYPSVYFDFRPFEYKLELPLPRNARGKQQPNPLYVTEWITVEGSDVSGLGYTPHMRISNKPYVGKSDSTEAIFKQMVKSIILTPLGSSKSSVVKNAINIGPNNNKSNSSLNSYITNFIQFIKNYDGVVFDIRAVTEMQSVKLTDRAISVLYYDLIHDSVFKKNTYGLAKFKATLKKQFYTMAQASGIIEEQVNELIGAGTAKKSHDTYGKSEASILMRAYGGGLVKNKKGRGQTIKLVPSIFKTLGDLSQFIYAATYNTVVASGDKMGLATGLFVCASNGRKLKLMMEDAVTGFVLYTGFDTINFVSKTSCISQPSGACSRNGVTRNKTNVANKIRASSGNNKVVELIVKSRPVRPRLDVNLRTFTNSGPSLTKNAAQAFFNKVNKFLPHFTEDELVKVERILDSIERRITPANKNIVNRNLRALRRGITIAKTGENQNKQLTGVKRGRNTSNGENNRRPTQTPRQANQGNRTNTASRQANQGNRTNTASRQNKQLTGVKRGRNTSNGENNRRNPTTATPRQNNQGNQKTATATPRQNTNRGNQKTATATPRQNTNRGNRTNTASRQNNSNRSNLTRTTRSGTHFGKSQNLKTNSSSRPNGAK